MDDGPAWYESMIWMKLFIDAPKESPQYKHKKKNLFLYGDSNMGKTKYFLEQLKKRLRCYRLTKDSVFMHDYDNSANYQLIYIDEFAKTKNIQSLNELCDVSEDGTDIRRFYGYDTKDESPPSIVTGKLININ